MKDEKDGVMEAGDQPERLKTQPIYPPRDSAVLLEPRGFRLDARIQARWLELAREYRTWRGAILAASFQLEYVLDQIIAEYFFPGVQRAIPDSDSDRQGLAESTVLKETFEQSFLRSGLMLMGRKRELVLHLLGGSKRFGHLLSEELRAALRTANETRNLFAHGPVYFRSRGEAPDEDFIAVLVGSKGAEKELSPEICQTFKPRYWTSVGSWQP